MDGRVNFRHKRIEPHQDEAMYRFLKNSFHTSESIQSDQNYAVLAARHGRL